MGSLRDRGDKCHCPLPCRCPVPDERHDWLCDHWKPASKVPAFLNVVDIAGLVKGRFVFCPRRN